MFKDLRVEQTLCFFFQDLKTTWLLQKKPNLKPEAFISENYVPKLRGVVDIL